MEFVDRHATFIIRFKSIHWTETEYRHMIGVMYGIIVGVTGKPIQQNARSITRYRTGEYVLYMDMPEETADKARQLIEESYKDFIDIKLQTFEIA